MHYLKEKIVTAWQEQKRLLLFHGNKKGCLIRATLYIHGGENSLAKNSQALMLSMSYFFVYRSELYQLKSTKTTQGHWRKYFPPFIAPYLISVLLPSD
jgi:hypothetical protein